MPDLKISQLPTKTTPGTGAVVPIVEAGVNYQATVQSLVTAGAPVLSVAGKTGAVTLSAADVSGLAASATTDTTDASNITAGTLSASRIGAHNQDWSTILSTPTTMAGYGITDGVSSGDSRLTNARTPTAHKTTHATGGTDALSAADIGAATSGHAHGSLTNDGKIGSASGQIIVTTTGGVLASAATISAASVSGLAAVATTGSASDLATGTLLASRLPATAVTLGSYGSASSVATFTVGSDGRLTAAASTAISIAAGAVSGLAASATTDTTNATNISSGTLAIGRIPTGTTSTTVSLGNHAHGNITSAGAIGVTANLPIITTTSGVLTVGSFGTAANTFASGNHTHGNITTAGAIGATSGQIVVTTTGGVLTTAATIASSSVSGLAASATTDTTNASNISTGTLAIGRIPTGQTSTTVPLGNDARFTDARVPLAHTHLASEISNSTADGRTILTGSNMYACRAWVNFSGSTAATALTGTYSQTLTTVTVTITGHGFTVGQRLTLDFTTGTSIDTACVVATVPNANTFTATVADSRSSTGNVTVRRRTIRDSQNVSSVTDFGIGYYFINFLTQAPDANYCVVASHYKQSGTAAVCGTIDSMAASGFMTQSVTAAAVSYDPDTICAAAFW